MPSVDGAGASMMGCLLAVRRRRQNPKTPHPQAQEKPGQHPNRPQAHNLPRPPSRTRPPNRPQTHNQRRLQSLPGPFPMQTKTLGELRTTATPAEVSTILAFATAPWPSGVPRAMP